MGWVLRSTPGGQEVSVCRDHIVVVHVFIEKPSRLSWAWVDPGLLRERCNAKLAFISGRAAMQLSTFTQPRTSREMVEFRRGHVSALSSLIEVCQWDKKWTRSTRMEHAEYCRSQQGCSASLLSVLQLVLRLQHFHFQRHLLFYFASSTC